MEPLLVDLNGETLEMPDAEEVKDEEGGRELGDTKDEEGGGFSMRLHPHYKERTYRQQMSYLKRKR